jgi:hypothetical protein
MDGLSATSLNGACRALPRESSDELSCDTAGWQVSVAAARAATGSNPQRPAAVEPTMPSTLMPSTLTSAPPGPRLKRADRAD